MTTRRALALLDRLGSFVDLLWLNLLWLISCALVVTAPAGTAAMIAVTAERRAGNPQPVLPHFLAHLRRRFGTATLAGGSWLAVGLILWVDLRILRSMDQVPPLLRLSLIVLICLYALAGAMLFQILATTDLTSWHALRAAVLMSWLAPGHALQATLAVGLAVLAVLTAPLLLFVVGALAAHVMVERWSQALDRYESRAHTPDLETL